MKYQSTLLFSIAAFAAMLPDLDAAIVVVAPTSTTDGSAHITQDITFDINVNGILKILALNDWVTADESKTGSVTSPMVSLSLNGGTPQSYSAAFVDNLADSFGALTSGDGYFTLDGPSVSVGDVVTFQAANYSLPAISGFNPQGNQTFTGEVFLTDNSGIKLSNSIAVPEPATLLYFALCLLAWVFRRRYSLEGTGPARARLLKNSP